MAWKFYMLNKETALYKVGEGVRLKYARPQSSLPREVGGLQGAFSRGSHLLNISKGSGAATSECYRANKKEPQQWASVPFSGVNGHSQLGVEVVTVTPELS